MGARLGQRPPRDPWAQAPVGELADPLLPRWFVLLAVALVPVAVGVFAVALAVGGGGEPVPVAERRPPPAGGFSHAVGTVAVGDSEPVAVDPACPRLDGVRVAGTADDRELLRQALARLCRAGLADTVAEALRAFADAGGTLRFAVFEVSGVDSVADLDADRPRILVNAKFVHAREPRLVAPLLAHDAVVLAGDAELAETALAARRAEHALCRRLLAEQPTRGCADAAELLALPDPVAALRAAGYR